MGKKPIPKSPREWAEKAEADFEGILNQIGAGKASLPPRAQNYFYFLAQILHHASGAMSPSTAAHLLGGCQC